MAKQPKAKLGFWIDQNLADEIEKRHKDAKITKTQFIVEAVIEKLSGESADGTVQELQRTQEMITEMRLEMANLARALLTQSGEDKDPMPRERVMQWLESNMDGRGIR